MEKYRPRRSSFLHLNNETVFHHHFMRRIQSRIILVGALTFALVAQANATDAYDYKPGEFLVIYGGTSPNKKLSIVAGEKKTGEFAIYLRDAQAKKADGTTGRSGNRSGFCPLCLP